jgi:hypothetical protein
VIVPGAWCLVTRPPAAALATTGAVCLVLVLTSLAHAQMPDPRAMHGQAIPAGELPAGSVTVRVVRQALGNNVAGATVELHGAGPVRTAVTAADGRAQFSGVPPGGAVHAIAVVDGERLESSAFEVPRAGGVRTILVAGLGLGSAGSTTPPASAPSAAPPTTAAPGELTFGNNTRLAIEFQDDTITVFYLLELVNPGASVTLEAPLVFALPEEATGATKLEGGSPIVTVAGNEVSIAGIVPPGVTAAPVAYRIEQWDARHTIAQRFPLPIAQLAIGVQRLPGLEVESAQATSVREASLSGQAFLIATGPRLAAQAPLQLTLSGLPHRSRLPRTIAFGLAALVAVFGVYLSMNRSADRAAARRRVLETRRRKGLAALASLEADRAAGRVAGTDYADRRAGLLADLERVYGELDALERPPDGGQGLAA